MTKISVNKSFLALALAGLASLPAGRALASSAHTIAAAKSRTFKGLTEQTQYGPVQVSITTKSRKITSVKVSASPDFGRSVLIESQAIPILRSETLRAQSASINGVSGATQTSEGYIGSLQAAVNAARKAKALK